MFEYKCPHCGWVIKSPTIFEEKKPCLNCDGFVELQDAQQGVQRMCATPQSSEFILNSGLAHWQGTHR